MKKTSRNSGIGVVEVLVVIGLVAIIAMASLSLMTNLFKGVSTAQKSATRTDTLKAISSALSNIETCKEAMGAGTLMIPAGWGAGASSALNIPRIRVGAELLAEVGTAIDGIVMKDIELEMISGPYPVQYNVAAAGTTPDLRNYQRYFAKLTVTPAKSGGANNNLGGEDFKRSEFKLALLVTDTRRLHECFGGLDESDVLALCENGFEGQFDSSRFPWCTPQQMSIGVHKSSLTAQYPRFAVLEKQNATNATWDLTMALYGNSAANSNGPGLWFASRPTTAITNTGDLAVLGYANRIDAYTVGSKPGDFIISNRRNNGTLEIGTRDVHMKMNQVTRDITMNSPLNIIAPEAPGFTKAPLSVFSTNGQGRIIIAGVSDAGQTYSAVYLNNNDPTAPLQNSWVLAHKAPASGTHHSFQINRWIGGTMVAGIAITPTMNFGVGTMTPSEKLDVAGNALVNGTLRVTGNSSFGGNVTVAGTVTASSDRTLKKNITPLKDNLKKVMQLRPVSYQWKTETKSAAREIGFIAQEVENVIPEVVKTGPDGLKSVAYGNLVAVVAGAIQELFQQLNSVLSKLQSNQSQMRDIENRLNEALQLQSSLEAENQMLEKQIRLLKEGSQK